MQAECMFTFVYSARHSHLCMKLKGICDATWGSDPDDERSVLGYILYFLNVIKFIPINIENDKVKVTIK